MANHKQLTPGMTISLNGKLYRVESCVKVTVPKGTPFIKTKLKDLESNQLIEKNFKPEQMVNDVSLVERNLEFLYPEGKGYLFLNLDTLEQVYVPEKIIEKKVNYLKEGIALKASFFGDTIFAVELPQFMELMVAKTENRKMIKQKGEAVKVATLETGAQIEIPPFIEVGDVIKVDTKTEEYIQRV